MTKRLQGAYQYYVKALNLISNFQKMHPLFFYLLITSTFRRNFPVLSWQLHSSMFSFLCSTQFLLPKFFSYKFLQVTCSVRCKWDRQLNGILSGQTAPVILSLHKYFLFCASRPFSYTSLPQVVPVSSLTPMSHRQTS